MTDFFDQIFFKNSKNSEKKEDILQYLQIEQCSFCIIHFSFFILKGLHCVVLNIFQQVSFKNTQNEKKQD